MRNYQKKIVLKLKLVSGLLVCLPFIRCVILNGSLASGTFKESSDIDLLIIASDDRIFTARFFSVGLLKLLGLKRPKEEQLNHAGKFCLNFFLTENFLEIARYKKDEKRNKYCAENYSKSILVAGDDKIFKKYIRINRKNWARYIDFEKPNNVPQIKFQNSKLPKVLQKVSEMLLSGVLGNWLEQTLKEVQIKSIETDPRTKQYPELIVYNDKELRFHPPKS